eukprot:g56403.t1
MKLKKPVTHICGWAKAKSSAKMWTDTDDTILHSFKEKKSTSDSLQSFHFERKRKFKCCGNAVELDGQAREHLSLMAAISSSTVCHGLSSLKATAFNT